MDKRSTPWAGLAGVLMITFLVWLGAEMSRTDRANEVLVILVVCLLVSALALAAGYRRRRSRL